ncbi:hypothetical protein FHX37_2798 [Haloactinospora alba]|uniref:Uncharacterized protein n=1 Tax=Haloactinospora alba TaxID=405555 RepID=A0A543NLY4_9ACTN|nr:hypothetical protein FHX37_2798 [Haloactinospora alba]
MRSVCCRSSRIPGESWTHTLRNKARTVPAGAGLPSGRRILHLPLDRLDETARRAPQLFLVEV